MKIFNYLPHGLWAESQKGHHRFGFDLRDFAIPTRVVWESFYIFFQLGPFYYQWLFR